MQIGFSKKISESLLEDTLNHITSNIINSKKLKLSNFGTFTLREKKAEKVGTQKLKKKK